MTTMPTIAGYTSSVSLAGQTSMSTTLRLASGNLQTNDWIICFLTAAAQATLTHKPNMVSDGWTEILPITTPGSGTTCFGIYARKRLATDGDTYPVTMASDGQINWPYYWMMFIRGADALSNWTVGTFANRASNATTTTAVAPSINVPTANSLALSIAEERTTASETASQVTVSNVDSSIFVPPAGGCDQTIVVGSKAMYSAGATGTATTTWPNTHAQNGIAGWVSIPPVPDAPAPVQGLAVKVSDGTTLKDSRVMISDGTNLFAPTSLKVVQRGYASVTQMLAQPVFYCAHRGGSYNYPEMSAYSYGQSVLNSDYPALEISLARTSDGVWFGLHDASLDRTSQGTGGGSGTNLVAANMTWSQVLQYTILGSTASVNTNQPNRPYMRFEELMDVYYDSHVFFIDPKVAVANASELMAIMNGMRGNPRERFVCKYYGVAGGSDGTSGWIGMAKANGYRTWGYFYEADQSNFTQYAPRWDILGMDYNASQASWDALKAAAPGKPIMGHICPDATSVQTALSKGAVGAMCSNTTIKPPAIK